MKATQQIILVALAALISLASLPAQSSRSTTPAAQNYPSRTVSAPRAERAPTGPEQPAASPTRPAPAAASTEARGPVTGAPIGSRFDSNLYTVEKTVLSSSQVGEDYQYLLRVRALEDITNIHVVEHLPEDLQFVSATPEAETSGRDLSWHYGSLGKGETLDHVITVRPTREGTFVTSSMVCVDPIVVLPLFAGAPRLEIAKTGPASAELDSTIPFRVAVRNTGTALAREVVLTDILPEGLTHGSGEREITHAIGDLSPGEAREVAIPVVAAARGLHTNTARAQFRGGEPVETTAAVTVVQSRIGVAKTGPAHEYVFKNATYDITVTNEGDAPLSDIVVTDEIPRGTTVVAGAEARGNRAVWNIPSLAPGESRSFSLTLTTTAPGVTTNAVTARASNGVSASAQAVTEWEGAPGVLTELIDTQDPIRVGESTVYEIRITNQGTLKPVNASVKLLLSENLRATSATGDAEGSIDPAGVIVFPDVMIPPRGSIRLRVPAEAVAPGIGKARLEFLSSFLNEALIKEESTFVY